MTAVGVAWVSPTEPPGDYLSDRSQRFRKSVVPKLERLYPRKQRCRPKQRCRHWSVRVRSRCDFRKDRGQLRLAEIGPLHKPEPSPASSGTRELKERIRRELAGEGHNLCDLTVCRHDEASPPAGPASSAIIRKLACVPTPAFRGPSPIPRTPCGRRRRSSGSTLTKSCATS